jgi:hypothetical protein
MHLVCSGSEAAIFGDRAEDLQMTQFHGYTLLSSRVMASIAHHHFTGSPAGGTVAQTLSRA